MNRNDYIKAVAEKGKYTQKGVRAMISVMQEVAYEAAKEDGGCAIFNGLTLETRMKDARMARNPKTGESVEVPVKRVPHVKIGKAFKDSVAL